MENPDATPSLFGVADDLHVRMIVFDTVPQAIYLDIAEVLMLENVVKNHKPAGLYQCPPQFVVGSYSFEPMVSINEQNVELPPGQDCGNILPRGRKLTVFPQQLQRYVRPSVREEVVQRLSRARRAAAVNAPGQVD